MKVTLFGFWLIPFVISVYAPIHFLAPYEQRLVTNCASPCIPPPTPLTTVLPRLLRMQRFWRMISLWSVFTGITLYLVYKASRKPLDRNTPRLVYGWFFSLYYISYAVGLLGYLLLLSDIFLLSRLLGFPYAAYWGLHMLFYGLYDRSSCLDGTLSCPFVAQLFRRTRSRLCRALHRHHGL